MAGPNPTEYFAHAYYLNQVTGSPGHYTIDERSFASANVQDYADSAADNLTQLGDIAQDHYSVTLDIFGQEDGLRGIYVGETGSGTSFVGQRFEEPFHLLYTNNTYSVGDAITAFGVPFNIVCFQSGTRLQTDGGPRAVEDLAAGDLVVTASGTVRPIRWLGHRTINCRRHPRPAEVMPVRFAAHALGENLPTRDLYVSPGHAICVDAMGEVLIPAAALVNGTTVSQVEVETVTYWHVELDSHDVLLAENLPAESYLEMGNRSFFAEAEAVELHALPDAPVATHADFCRPYVDHGPQLDLIRARLAARAGALADERRNVSVAA